jgi:voltage-gated potassium channel
VTAPGNATTTPTVARSNDVLARLDGWFELVMVALGLVWLGLVVAELATTVPSWLEHVGTAIWAIFVADFVGRLALSDHRLAYLRHNWLALIALIVPALRVFRIARFVSVLRAARAVRGVRAVRLVTTFARARRSVHALLAARNALGYVVAVTVAIALLGAAGMYAFESGPGSRFESYGHALWWTTMLLMTMGTEAWPATALGRVLSVLLALYGFAVFGYITAQLASWLIGRKAER